MAFNSDGLKTNVEGKITGLTGSETITQLVLHDIAAKAVTPSNYSTLQTAIQTKVDAQTSSTDISDLVLATKAMGLGASVTSAVDYRTYTQ